MGIENWKIVYIPDKPPVSPTQQPTVSVFVSTIDPKVTNTLVRKLNQIAPLESYRHVKRVRKESSSGPTQLTVVLCLADQDDSQLDSMPKELLELVKCYQLSPYVTRVCKFAATTKEEWEEQCKLWPTSFHPPTYNIDGITGFNEEDSKKVFHFMKFAVDLAKSNHGQWVNAAVIVDPFVNQVIASACDEITSWSICPDANDNTEHLLNEDEPSTTGVSCLNPWQWSQQHVASSSSCWHPLRHAAMVAIECSAARDRRLFPSLENTAERDQLEPMDTASARSPAKKLKTESINGENGEKVASDGLLSKSERPYLCTGNDIYLAWEPCAMCAMALVHQRFRRIFYSYPNPNTGALGSVHRLQGEKSLNHHYAVFRVILDDECLGKVEVGKTKPHT